MTENTSGLSPKGRAVLVEPYEPKRKASVIFIPESVEQGLMLLDTMVRVIEVGPGCWPDEKPRATPGEIVIIARMSGMMVQGRGDGKTYRLINDRDIVCGVTHLEE